MAAKLRIVIADDHPVLRRGLRQVLETSGDLEVVAEAGDGEAARNAVEALRPDVVLLDIKMPKLSGFDVVRQLGDDAKNVTVVFLTMYKDEELLNAALDLGARGYVLKDSAVSDIVECVRAVAGGRYYLSPAVSGQLVARMARASASAGEKRGLHDLTRAERQVVQLIASGKTSREIADGLFISVRTVENHRANICRKLELHGSHALLKYALAHSAQLA